MPDRASAGLLPHAYLCSWVGMVVAVVSGIFIATADLTAYVAGESVIAPEMHGVVVSFTVALFLSSLMVQIGCRIIRWQRRIVAELERIGDGHDPTPGREVEPAEIEGLTPEMVALARRTSVRLRGAA